MLIFKFYQKKGFTLIETLIAVAVLSIFFAIVAIIVNQVLQNIAESKIRAIALSVGQERMERIRNLPYASVGTQGGIPQGSIIQNETVNINGLTLTIKTSIIYVDDPFDGTVPADLLNADYKRARVELTWGGVYPSRFPVTFVTNISPKGIETAAGGGTLVIQVLNTLGQPISNATVTVINTMTTPQINLQTLTDQNGLAIIPAAPACVSCYQLTITKTGYSTDKTYSTSQVANPLQPHATVIEGNLTQATFSIDEISSLTINAYDPNYLPASNVFITLRGAKIIGYDTTDNPVYKYAQNYTIVGGQLLINTLESDTYSLDYSNSYHTLAGSNPLLPVILAPKTNQIITTINVPKTNTSLLVTVQNTLNELQGTAVATLSSTLLGYSNTKITASTGSADFGQVFFPSLTYGTTYDLSVSLNSYQSATSSILITSNQQERVTLNQ